MRYVLTCGLQVFEDGPTSVEPRLDRHGLLKSSAMFVRDKVQANSLG